MLLLQCRVILTTWSHLPKVTILLIRLNSAADILGNLHKEQNTLPAQQVLQRAKTTAKLLSSLSPQNSTSTSIMGAVQIPVGQNITHPQGTCSCPGSDRCGRRSLGSLLRPYCAWLVWNCKSRVGLLVELPERPSFLPGSCFTGRIWINFNLLGVCTRYIKYLLFQ